MTDRAKNIMIVCIFTVFLFAIFFWEIFAPKKAVSESERRSLADFPVLSSKTVLSGRFMKNFENYAMDQFPLRDSFRTAKALSSFYVFCRKDVNSIYRAEGHLSKLEYPLQEASVSNAADKLHRLYDEYLANGNTRVYMSVIPDKNYFLAEANGYLSMDYDALAKLFVSQMDASIKYIDIYNILELSDYYKTDTHWRQEKIVDVAAALASEMGVSISTDYQAHTLEEPFYGVYHGQAALPLLAEPISYLENDALNMCTVFDHETNKEIDMYNMELAQGRDPYELFLSGAKGLLTIKNPSAQNDRCLILFRDSFGSSIAPLLATGYSKVVLIDIRYLSSALLSDMVDFRDSDVLFLYSTLVLNHSEMLK